MTSPGRSDQGPAVPPLRRVDPNPSGTLAADSEVNCHPPRPERATRTRGNDKCRGPSHRFRAPCRQDPMPAHPGSPRVSPALASYAVSWRALPALAALSDERVDDRQHEQREDRGRNQAADDHAGEWPLDLRADAMGDRGRDETDDGDDPGNDDGAEAQRAAPHNRVEHAQALSPRLADRGHQHDPIQYAHAEDRDVADGRGDVEVGSREEKRQRAADERKRQVQHDEQCVPDRLEGAEEQDEDDEDDERHDDVEPRQSTLLVFEPPRPHDAVLFGQLHGGVHLLHRLRDHAAHVALADTPFDGDAPLAAFALDLAQALRLLELCELRHWNAFTARRAHRQVLEHHQRFAAPGEPHREVEAALALEDLADDAPARGPLDRILNVLDVDAVARGGPAVDDDLQLRLADEMVVIEVRHTADVAKHVGDLSGDAFELEDISPVELDGQLALHAGERLVDVVLDRLREVRGDPRDGLDAPRHRLDQLVLVVDAPLVARFEPDVELGGVGAVDVGAVVRRAELGDHNADLGEGQQPLADVVDIRVGVLQRDTDGELHAQPDIPLVQLGQELLAEQREGEQRECEHPGRDGDRYDRPSQAEAQRRHVRSA